MAASRGVMSEKKNENLTRLLLEAATDPVASERLLPLVYDELRRLAGSRLAKLPPGQTLRPTDLVHEAYLNIASDPRVTWDSRGHFFGAAAQAMRNILVDAARRKQSLKRGKGRKRVDIDVAQLAVAPPDDDVLAVDEALTDLEAEDPEKARMVLLRYFLGLTTEETADILQTSPSSVERRWRFTRAWLRRRMGRRRDDAGGQG